MPLPCRERAGRVSACSTSRRREPHSPKCPWQSEAEVNEPWLEVVIATKERETDDIVRLELRDAAGQPLPPFTAGAHIDLEVTTRAGSTILAVQQPR